MPRELIKLLLANIGHSVIVFTIHITICYSRELWFFTKIKVFPSACSALCAEFKFKFCVMTQVYSRSFVFRTCVSHIYIYIYKNNRQYHKRHLSKYGIWQDYWPQKSNLLKNSGYTWTHTHTHILYDIIV